MRRLRFLKIVFALVILSAVLLGAVRIYKAAKDEPRSPAVAAPDNAVRPPNTVFIGAKGKWRVELAATLDERARGLSNRAALPAENGMIFLFNEPGRYGFWMKEMRFPLDIIWISNDQVIGLSENLLPEGAQPKNIYYPPAPADTILEINAGEAETFGIITGDVIKLGYEE